MYTHNRKLKRQLKELSISREDCKLKTQDEHSHTYEIPKTWIKIRPKRILSEEEYATLVEKAKRMRG